MLFKGQTDFEKTLQGLIEIFGKITGGKFNVERRDQIYSNQTISFVAFKDVESCDEILDKLSDASYLKFRI